MLSQAEHRRIELAVGEAEANTSGEIVCILAGEVSNYREVPLALAAAVALLAPPIALLLGLAPSSLTPWARDWSAGQATAIEPLLSRQLENYALLQVLLFALTAVIVAIPAVRRTLTPPSLKSHRVHRAALQQFLATGLHASAERTGVVIFAAQHDRRVEILADDAIHEAVGDTAWNAAVKAVQDGMRKADAAGGFVRAIEICGHALAEHFPAKGPHVNALPDRLIEL